MKRRFAILLAGILLCTSGCNMTHSLESISNFEKTGNMELSEVSVIDSVSNTKVYQFIKSCTELKSGVLEIYQCDKLLSELIVDNNDSFISVFSDADDMQSNLLYVDGRLYTVIQEDNTRYEVNADGYNVFTVMDGMLDNFKNVKLSETSGDVFVFDKRDDLKNAVMERSRFILTENSVRIESVGKESEDYMVITKRSLTDADKKKLLLSTYKEGQVSQVEKSS